MLGESEEGAACFDEVWTASSHTQDAFLHSLLLDVLLRHSLYEAALYVGTRVKARSIRYKYLAQTFSALASSRRTSLDPLAFVKLFTDPVDLTFSLGGLFEGLLGSNVPELSYGVFLAPILSLRLL